ncbi:unnamed protein product [Prorocentrum cordatum]|uniref:Uncharacterized protein n=1 Tax=Prorocentrum cordatum TaxID=2364126 RepID=A0ABN9R8Q2_9DINO|nr:unnamed protein product [Polarella glacialis]
MAAGKGSTAMPTGERDAPSQSTRHHPNPLISVGDLQQCIEKFIQEDRNDNRDIYGFFEPVVQASLTWKTAPRADLLLHVKPLLMRLLVACTNGCAPALKLEKALKLVDDDKKANFSNKSQEVWAIALSTMIRIMLSNLRDAKHVAEARRRCFQKAGAAEADGINVMMEMVRTNVDEEVEALPRSQSAPPGPRAPTRALAKRDKSPDPEVSDVDLPSAFKRLAADLEIGSGTEDDGYPSASAVGECHGHAPPLMQPNGISGDDWDALRHVQELAPVRPPRKRKVTPMKTARKVAPMKTARKVAPVKTATAATPMTTAKVAPVKTAAKVTPMKAAMNATPMKTAKVTPMKTAKVTPMMAAKVTERPNNKPDSVEEQQLFKDEGIGCLKDRWFGYCPDCKAKRAAHALRT